MPKSCSLIDLSKVDMNHIVADIDEIRRQNPQRFEMEQLTAIVYADTEEMACVGYQDVSPEAFWCRGHMPGFPLMPGVMICEAAAQVASFFSHKLTIVEGGFIGFGGMDEVKFRGVVRPGDRLVVVDKLLKYRKNMMMIFAFEALVNGDVVAEGMIKGVRVPKE